MIALVPLVDVYEELEEWDTYAQENQGWIMEGLASQGLSWVEPGTVRQGVYYEYAEERNKASNGITGHALEEDEFTKLIERSYAPIW